MTRAIAPIQVDQNHGTSKLDSFRQAYDDYSRSVKNLKGQIERFDTAEFNEEAKNIANTSNGRETLKVMSRALQPYLRKDNNVLDNTHDRTEDVFALMKSKASLMNETLQTLLGQAA